MYFCAKYFLVFDFGLILLKHMFFIFFLIRLKYGLLFVNYHQYSSLLRLKLFHLFDYSIVFYFGAVIFPYYVYLFILLSTFHCILLDIIHFSLHFFWIFSIFLSYFTFPWKRKTGRTREEKFSEKEGKRLLYYETKWFLILVWFYS